MDTQITFLGTLEAPSKHLSNRTANLILCGLLEICVEFIMASVMRSKKGIGGNFIDEENVE